MDMRWKLIESIEKENKGEIKESKSEGFVKEPQEAKEEIVVVVVQLSPTSF